MLCTLHVQIRCFYLVFYLGRYKLTPMGAAEKVIKVVMKEATI